MNSVLKNYSKIVVAGGGYTGSRLVKIHSQNKCNVVVLTKSTRVTLNEVKSIQIDLDHSISKQIFLPEDSLVYYLIPPPKAGNQDPRIRKFINECIDGTPKRFILISTTGVYGDCAGKWVDECTVVNPDTERARRRLDAEVFVGAWAKKNSVDLTILRVAGIYGPGRIPVERIKSGLTLPPKNECGYSNRVHVDDLVSTCLAASTSLATGVFNVADGTPSRMIEYFNLVAEIWGLPPVQESPAPQVFDSLSVPMRQYLRESRKISNRRIQEDLGVELRYPNAKLGLNALFKSQRNSVD